MGNNFSSKYELFRNVKADDKKGLNRNYGIFLVLRRKTGLYKKIWKDETRIDKIVRKEDKILNGLKKALFL